MGYIRHHAIVVTSHDEEAIRESHGSCRSICGDRISVTAITDEATNGYRSFMVAPDGSKEGWAESNKGDETRDRVVELLRADWRLDWVEVAFGEHVSVVTRCHKGEDDD